MSIYLYSSSSSRLPPDRSGTGMFDIYVFFSSRSLTVLDVVMGLMETGGGMRLNAIPQAVKLPKHSGGHYVFCVQKGQK